MLRSLKQFFFKRNNNFYFTQIKISIIGMVTQIVHNKRHISVQNLESRKQWIFILFTGVWANWEIGDRCSACLGDSADPGRVLSAPFFLEPMGWYSHLLLTCAMPQAQENKPTNVGSLKNKCGTGTHTHVCFILLAKAKLSLSQTQWQYTEKFTSSFQSKELQRCIAEVMNI